MKVLSSLIILLCLFLCLTSNYTFPLKRDHRSNWFWEWYRNHSSQCDSYPMNVSYSKKIGERSNKKTAFDIGNPLQKVKSYSQDLSKNLYNRLNRKFSNQLNDDDFRQYEQLVIMKKYPYLNFKELESKYSPSSKNVRQSMNVDPDVGRDVNLCDDDCRSVEITNRGLSGFAIPTQMKKVENIMEQALNFDSGGDTKMQNFKHSKEYPLGRQYD